MEEEKLTIKQRIRNSLSTRVIAANGIIAAMYVVLTLICQPIAYNYMQVRLSELLNLLVFFNPTYIIGLTIGCLLANLASTVGVLDIGLGTAATFISCLLVIFISKKVKCLFLAGLIPCIVNAAIVPLTIYLTSVIDNVPMELSVNLFIMMGGWVMLGEVIAILAVGYPLFLVCMKKVKGFPSLINTTRNLDFKW